MAAAAPIACRVRAQYKAPRAWRTPKVFLEHFSNEPRLFVSCLLHHALRLRRERRMAEVGPGAWPRQWVSGGNVVKGSGAHPGRLAARRGPLCKLRLLRPPTSSGVDPEGRSLGPTASAEVRAEIALRKAPAKGSRVRAEEWESLFDRAVGRASFQSHGFRPWIELQGRRPGRRSGTHGWGRVGWRGAFCA